MSEAKFVKMEDGMAEYEIGENDEEKVTCDGKEYKAQKIERRQSNEEQNK